MITTTLATSQNWKAKKEKEKNTGWKGKKKLSTNSKGENLEMEVGKINK
jgi:hypothetical protein